MKSRVNVLRVSLWILPLGLLIWASLRPVVTTRWVDFPVYYEAGTKAESHQTVYDVKGHFQFKYSPFIAWVFGQSFKSLSFEEASLVYRVFSIIVWVGVFALAAFGFSENRWGPSLASVFLAQALLFELELGQINGIPLLLILSCFYFLKEKNLRAEILAGALFAIAIQIKLYWLPAGLILLFTKRGVAISSALLTLLATQIGVLTLVHGFEFTWSENLRWFNSLSQSSEELLLSPYNTSLLGVLGKWGVPLVLAKLIWGGALLCWGQLLYRMRRKESEVLFSFLIFGILVLNPLVWSYWVVLLAPVLIGLNLKLPTREPKGLVVLAVAGLFVFISFWAQHAQANWNGPLLLSVVGVFWAWWTMTLRDKRIFP